MFNAILNLSVTSSEGSFHVAFHYAKPDLRGSGVRERGFTRQHGAALSRLLMEQRENRPRPSRPEHGLEQA